VDRKAVYITNTVKHFKWRSRGKRRLHDRPNSRNIAACRPWLESEFAALKPKFLVLLGCRQLPLDWQLLGRRLSSARVIEAIQQSATDTSFL
jgi:uracil-DNA glycosylase family 4